MAYYLFKAATLIGNVVGDDARSVESEGGGGDEAEAAVSSAS